jgi:hypothetical protein
MANCTGIFQGQSIDCHEPLSVGIVQRTFLANIEDIEEYVYSVVPGEENVIETITMKLGTQFWEFDGVNESISTQSELVRRTTSNSYKHTLGLTVFEVDNIALQNLQGMAYIAQVAIVLGPNDSSLGNGAFQVLGKNIGLDLATNVRINGDVETGGGHVLSLSTPDSGGAENEEPNVLWETDYATTLSYIETTLLNPAV